MSELNDFLKLIAEGKKTDPVAVKAKEFETTIKESVKADLGSLFAELSSLKQKKAELIEAKPELIEEETIQEEVITEVAPPLPTPIGKVPAEVQIPDIDKYLKAKTDTPKVDPLTNEFKQVNDKIKFLERWIGQIQNAGPGSGEVNFRYLDDVNRGTMNPGNDNWVLEYDSATKKVQFTEHVGPIRTVKFNTTGPQQALVTGQMGWNPIEDCLDIKQADDTTLQVGLEHYFQIHNNSGSTLQSGDVVMFSGVDEVSVTNPVVEVVPYLANANATPLYLVGVMTNTVDNGDNGRATVFGKVRNINTTGSVVGETWAKGDLLWAHPTQSGKMTKVRPTAPNVATSVAAVLQVGTTDGVILVRPTIWPRLFYGDWYDTTNQVAAAINTAYPVKINSSGAVSGFTLVNGDTIKALNAGRYNFEFSLQVTSSNSSSSRVYIWYRKNGVDVPHSTTILTIAANGGKLAPAWNFPVLMDPNDTFTLMWATDATTVSLSAEPATAFCPSIPSVILTVAQTNL